jgi:hypothetical protein
MSSTSLEHQLCPANRLPLVPVRKPEPRSPIVQTHGSPGVPTSEIGKSRRIRITGT